MGRMGGRQLFIGAAKQTIEQLCSSYATTISGHPCELGKEKRKWDKNEGEIGNRSI